MNVLPIAAGAKVQVTSTLNCAHEILWVYHAVPLRAFEVSSHVNGVPLDDGIYGTEQSQGHEKDWSGFILGNFPRQQQQ